MNRSFGPRNEKVRMSQAKKSRHCQVESLRVCTDRRPHVVVTAHRHFLPSPTFAVESSFRAKASCQSMPAAHSTNMNVKPGPYANPKKYSEAQDAARADFIEKGGHPRNLIAALWVRLNRSDRQADVVSAEAEAVGDGDPHALLAGGIRDIIQVAERIWRIEIDRRMDDAMPDR